ncbi:MAG: hypothetical protein GDA52_07935 [Rhodobacteraceae bacterium]|nr:hypothetical protein [Paracoccaceae bacterium]
MLSPDLVVTPDTAQDVGRKLASLKRAAGAAHRELGSIEGFISMVGRDGFNRPVVWLKSRLDGQTIKCVSSNGGLDLIGPFKVSEVIIGLRARVHGTLFYQDLTRIKKVEAERVETFGDSDALPGMDDIVCPGFTNGLEACAWLKEART